MIMTNDYKIVGSYNNIIETKMAQGHLESADIPSKIVNDGAGGMEPQLQYTQGVYLLMRESDWEEASGILSDIE